MTIKHPQLQRRHDDVDDGVDVSTIIIALICIGLIFLFIVLPVLLCCYFSRRRRSRAMVIAARSRIVSPYLQSREAETGRPDRTLSTTERPEAIPLTDIPPPPYKERDEGGDPCISLPTSAYMSPRAMEDAETDWGRDVRSVFRQPANATQ